VEFLCNKHVTLLVMNLLACSVEKKKISDTDGSMCVENVNGQVIVV